MSVLGPSRQAAYEDVVMGLRPVLYVPLGGDVPAGGTGKIEMVRRIKLQEQGQAGAAVPTVRGYIPGGAVGMVAGVSEYLRVPTDTSYHPGDTFSVGGWFNRTGDGASSPSMLHLGTGDFVVWFTASEQLTLRKAGTGDIYVITSPTFPTPFNQGWHHIVFTKNGTSASNICTAYLDGVLNAATYTNRTIVAAAGNIGIGLNGASTDFEGSMQHWAIWNRVLTAGEARELYVAGLNAVA